MTNIQILQDLFFSQSKKFNFELGLSLAAREHHPQDAKDIIKEAIDLFLYTKHPAFIHVLGEARHEVLVYAQQLSKKVYDTTGDHRRTVVSADTSVPFFNAKEQLNDIRPVTVASKYRHFWQVGNHDLRPFYTINPNGTHLHLIPSEEFLKLGQYVTRELDLFSCELNMSNLQ